MDRDSTSDRNPDRAASEPADAFAKDSAKESAEAMAQEYVEAVTRDPQQIREWLGEKDLTYGGLIGIGVIMVQPFLVAGTHDLSASISVVAFALAIPLLAALVLLNRQETFRRRFARSPLVTVGQGIAQLSAFVGVAAGFWHIYWVAGAVMMSSAVLGMAVHSAGYMSVEPVQEPLSGAGRNQGDA